MSVFLENANVEEVLRRSYENVCAPNMITCPLCFVELVYSSMGINSHLRNKHLNKKEITRDELNKIARKLID